MEWLDRLADALGSEALSAHETERLLATAREVAHRVERKATPLAAYLIGMAVAGRVADGASRQAALDEVLEAVVHRLPEASA